MKYDVDRVTSRLHDSNGRVVALKAHVQRTRGELPFPSVVNPQDIPARFAYPTWFKGGDERPTIETYELQPEPWEGALHYLCVSANDPGECPACGTPLSCDQSGGSYLLLCKGERGGTPCTHAERLLWERIEAH